MPASLLRDTLELERSPSTPPTPRVTYLEASSFQCIHPGSALAHHRQSSVASLQTIHPRPRDRHIHSGAVQRKPSKKLSARVNWPVRCLEDDDSLLSIQRA